MPMTIAASTMIQPIQARWIDLSCFQLRESNHRRAARRYDAHDTGELEFYRYGVDVARRGWLEAKDVFNTRTLAQVEKALLGRR